MVPSTSSRKASLLKSGGSEGSTFGMSCIRARIVEAVAPKGAEPPERYAKAGQQPPPTLQPFDSAKVPAKNFGRGRRPCGRCGSMLLKKSEKCLVAIFSKGSAAKLP